jgi:hypothetical protein
VAVSIGLPVAGVQEARPTPSAVKAQRMWKREIHFR